MLHVRPVGSSSQRQDDPFPNLRFVQVSRLSRFWPTIVRSFREEIAQIYGDQSTALDKIRKGYDRHCELLLKSGHPVGFFVCKTDLSNEFAMYGVTNALELKTLILTNPKVNSGRGLATRLLLRVTALAKARGACNILVTASCARPQVLDFFYKYGFQMVRCYSRDTTGFVADEFLLRHNDIQSLDQLLRSKLAGYCDEGRKGGEEHEPAAVGGILI